MLNKKGCLNLNKLGGKAYNLEKLKVNNFNVPDFFVLDIDFFFEFLGEDLNTFKDNLRNYNELSIEKIKTIIENRDFTEVQKTFIANKLKEMFKINYKVSVRSSAVDEDGEKNSFAGMMESFLNVVNIEDVFHCVKKCYLSCFSERAMRYRENNNLITDSLGICVIIQQMIDADYSAVVFTSNPKTNNPDEVLISVVKGLGDGLVSGEKNSFDYIVDRFGNILENPEVFILSEEKILEILKLSLEIENSEDKKLARDIELCIKDEEVYILQERLITNYSHIDKKKFRTILDNSNIIESYSGATTDLTFSFAREVYEKIYRQTLNIFYVSQEQINSIDEDLKNMIYFYENNIYYRLNSWYNMTALYPGYNRNKKYMENMMGVKVEYTESNRNKKIRLLKIYSRFIYKLLNIKKDSKKFIDKFSKITAPYMNNYFEGFTNVELLKIYKNLELSILDDFITPITNDMGAMVFLGILNDKLKNSDINNYEGQLGKVLSKQGNVESVKQSLMLVDIVNYIWDDKALLKEFRDCSIDKLKANLHDNREINVKIREYINIFGSRSMDELKLETITLQEDPTFLFETIKNYLNMDGKVPVYKEQDIDESKLFNEFGIVKRIFIKNLVKITKFFVKNRELLRLRRTYIYSIVRNIFLRIGYNFANDNIIKNNRDIFFLTKDEVFNIIENNSYLDMKDIVENRKNIYNINKNKEIHERMYFYGDITCENMIPVYSTQEVATNNTNILGGVAGGGKVVEGIVKFVEDPKDANVEGYILMAKRTDPGWTVLFPMAEAIIIERGSVLSHSAVIAREMGLTLVVGIRGLTDRISEGMKVRVDGIKGTVEILDEEESR